MPYVVDTTKFQAEAAFLRWDIVARRLGAIAPGAAGVKLPEVLQLRWTLRDDLGFPSEPFTVWARPKAQRQPKDVNAEITTLAFFGNASLVDLRGSYSSVELNLSGGSGLVLAFVGAPLLSATVAFTSVAAGNNILVRLEAPSMEGLMVSATSTINSIKGVRTDDLSAAEGWQKYEYVGIPVKQNDWTGVGSHGVDQGLFGAFVSAEAAAIQRLERGAPPIGWAPMLDGSTPAPAWSAPAFGPLVNELNQTVLDDLRKIAGLPPGSHAGARVDKPMPPPDNSSGEAMSEPGSTSKVSPLAMTYMAAATDCFACLGLGFGTAYPVVFYPLGDHVFSLLDFDFMITARYENGHLGTGSPVEYAAIVPGPQQAAAPPIPTNLDEEGMGFIRPAAMNGNWRGSVRVTWDKPVPIPLFRARSFAFAKAGISPASAPSLVMNQRASGGPLPIAVNYYTNAQDPETNRLSAVDRETPIPSNPGSRSTKYAVAHQDIYGQWSTWSVINSVIQQPPLDKVGIVSADFQFTNIPTPPAATCAADLAVEFLWDWRIRSPMQISFRGRLHPASYRGEPPPSTNLPGGLQTQLGGPFPNTFTLNFNVLAANGAPTSSWPGYNPMAHCIALNAAGDTQVAFGNAQGSESRRYRVTIPSFQLNFGSTGHIGMALWALGQEAIAPNRDTGWNDQPLLISTSDPRPPVIVPDIVSLSSLPDAAGESHAVLKWSGTPGTDGYFIYETTETKLLRAVGDPEPDPDKTLSLRLTRLREIFHQDPPARRSAFTRRNSRLIKATSADVTIPRGSTGIHMYAVLGVSAGQVEAAWPSNADALYAYAVPRIPKPGTPMIEAVSFLDKNSNPAVYRAKVTVRTRKGPIVEKIDLHRVRVDDAAKELDTMGPPVVTVDSIHAGWDPQTDPEPHVRAEVQDTPTGSWKRVWYRAAAWSEPDPLRGTLTARSPASTAAWVVVPPTAPPNISALELEWPGGGAGDVQVKWTSTATLKKTPLGSHRISINARRVGSAPDEAALISFEGDLGKLGVTAPVTGSGTWRVDNTKPVQYRAIVRRSNVNDAVQVAIRITDPLGRTSASLATIAPGHILPDPVLGKFAIQASLAPGQILNFASTTPIDIGPYTLRVVLTRVPILHPPVILEMALDDVPIDEPGPVPDGIDPVRVRRMPGAGPNFNYYVFVRVPFSQILVRLSAPDGRSVQQIVQSL